MVGDDAQGHVRLVAVAIVRAGDLADLVGDVHDGVHVEERVHTLADNGQTLKAHAGVDVFLNEVRVVAVAVVVKLGKDVVPDLHIAVAVAAGRAVRLAAAVFLAAVKIDLRAGAARAGAVLPEVIVLAEAGDAALRDADLVAPDVERLVVLFIHGRVQPLWVEADPVRARQKLPRPGDGFMLEVVAEGEVAEHLKIRAVARGLADVFNVAGADALLAGADAVARRLLIALEVGLHRRHAGVDEQQARIILRDEREARQAQVPLRLEKAQEHLAQFIQTIWFHNHLSSNSNSLASLFLQPLGKAGRVRAVKLQLAAVPAGINIDLQRTGKEVGQVTGQKAVLPELQGFLPQMLHLTVTTQTVHNTSIPPQKKMPPPHIQGRRHSSIHGTTLIAAHAASQVVLNADRRPGRPGPLRSGCHAAGRRASTVPFSLLTGCCTAFLHPSVMFWIFLFYHIRAECQPFQRVISAARVTAVPLHMAAAW